MLKGSNSTTIDDIAQEAELSPATIYQYFRNKEELYASLNLINQINRLSHKVLIMFAHVYEEGVRQGKFIDGHGMAHADIIWAILTGLVLWEESKRNINPKKDFLKSTLDTAFEIFFGKSKFLVVSKENQNPLISQVFFLR